MVAKTVKDCLSSFSWRYLDYGEVKNDLCCTLDNWVVRWDQLGLLLLN
jgi:hypothetical protein